MNRMKWCLLIGIACLLFVGVAQAQEPVSTTPSLSTPRWVQFSGVLKDSGGQPLTGLQGLTFALYGAQEGGSALWLETQNVALDAEGRYAVLLGSTQSEGLPLELFSSNEARWLGVQASQSRDSDGAVLPEQPRVLLVSVPYALKAADAETLGGQPLSAFVLAAGSDGSATTSDKDALPQAFVRDTPITAAVAGTGAVNKLTKWLDTGGTLGDSAVFESGGLVGIGTLTPGAPLSVESSTPFFGIMVGENSGANPKQLLFGYDTTSNFASIQAVQQGVSYAPLVLQRNGGSVGIGTTTPASKLGVATSSYNVGIVVGENTAGTPKQLILGYDTANNYASILAVQQGIGTRPLVLQKDGGYVGIGTTNPGYKLDVAGSFRATDGVTGSSTTGTGVYGQSTALSGMGVQGYTVDGFGRGVYGAAGSATGSNYGVYGYSASNSGTGVFGYVSASGGAISGVYGRSDSPEGRGVYGNASASTGTTYGGYFVSQSTLGIGVYGLATNSGPNAYGVFGQSVGGMGVRGEGPFAGVHGQSASFSGTGVFGLATAGSGITVGGNFQSASPSGTGVIGRTTAGSGTTVGGNFLSASSSGTGVYGRATASSGTTYGGFFQSDSPDGTGLYGRATASSGTNYAVYGYSNSGYGVYGRGALYGVFSAGNAGVSGRLAVATDADIPATFNRMTTDGVVVDIQKDAISQGTISVSGDTVSYNAFTGSHYAWTQQPTEPGMLVSLTGENQRLHKQPGGEVIYGVAPTSRPNDSAVLGAYLGRLNPAEAAAPLTENPHLVAAVGNGDLWVVDTGADIAVGDPLISSATLGHAMKDDDRFAVSYMVARAAEPVRWAEVTEAVNGVKHKKISILFDSHVREKTTVLTKALAAREAELAELRQALAAQSKSQEALLIEAVKEQQAQIRQLQSEMDGLKARLGVEVSQSEPRP